jgi:hypothetical protein
MAARSWRNVCEQSAWQNARWTWLKNNRAPCPSRIGLSCRAGMGGIMFRQLTLSEPDALELAPGHVAHPFEPGAGLGLVAAADVAEHHLDQLARAPWGSPPAIEARRALCDSHRFSRFLANGIPDRREHRRSEWTWPPAGLARQHRFDPVQTFESSQFKCMAVAGRDKITPILRGRTKDCTLVGLAQARRRFD